LWALQKSEWPGANMGWWRDVHIFKTHFLPPPVLLLYTFTAGYSLTCAPPTSSRTSATIFTATTTLSRMPTALPCLPTARNAARCCRHCAVSHARAWDVGASYACWRFCAYHAAAAACENMAASRTSARRLLKRARLTTAALYGGRDNATRQRSIPASCHTWRCRGLPATLRRTATWKTPPRCWRGAKPSFSALTCNAHVRRYRGRTPGKPLR